MSVSEERVGDNRPPVYFDGDVMVIRASGMLGCTKAMAALAAGYDRMEPPESMQRRFDDGNLHEASILNEIERRFDLPLHRSVEGVQHTTVLKVHPTLEIRGSMDAVAARDGCPAEAKSMSKAMFAKWKSGGFRDFPYYAYQISIYMLGTDAEQAYYGVKNKDNGEIDCQIVPAPPVKKSEIIKRALEIEKGVKQALTNPMFITTLATCDRVQYPCPVYYLHEEITPVDLTEDVVLKGLCEDYDKARAAEAAAKADKDRIGEEIRMRVESMGEEQVSLDGWSITHKVGSRKVLDEKGLCERFGLESLDDFKISKPNSKPTLNITARKPGE